METPQPRRRWTLDSVAGARVGGAVGALLGVIVAVVAGIGYAWLIFVGGALGGALGLWSQTRGDRPG